MSEKTEEPTEKKKRDAAKKGQVFHPSDLCSWLTLTVGVLWLTGGTSLSGLIAPLRALCASGFTMPPAAFAHELLMQAIQIVASLLVAVIVPPTVLTLIACRFEIASEALIPDLNRLSPVSGFKRIFSRHTLLGLICAAAYCSTCALAVWIAWHLHAADLLASAWMGPQGAALAWQRLVMRPLGIALACTLPVALLHAFGERQVHRHDLLMEKHEVKRERRDLDGKPEVRARQRDLLLEMLDGQSRNDIASSSFVLANPTHIAVGIYIDRSVVEWPFVSVRETQARALAVIAYAESVGVPVVRDKRLARAVFRSSRRYGFIDAALVEAVMRVMNWLSDVERAGAADVFVQDLPVSSS